MINVRGRIFPLHLLFTNPPVDPLAYLTAKTNGLEEQCQSILEAAGLTEDQITLPKTGTPLPKPPVIVPTYQANWPVKSSGASSFEKALLAEGGDEEVAPATNGLAEDDFLDAETGQDGNGAIDEAEDEDAAGWDMGDDSIPEVEEDFVNVESIDAGAGTSETDFWTRNSPVAADHVAAGSYESAMNLLNRQVGAVNFKPLAARFEEVYSASRTYLPANPGLPPLVNYVRRTLKDTDSTKVLPLIPRDLESITGNELVQGKQHMQKNKLEEGVQAFKKILHLMLVNAVSSPSQLEEVCQYLASKLPLTTLLMCSSRQSSSSTPPANMSSQCLLSFHVEDS